MEKRPDLWPEPDPVGAGQESVWDFPRPPRLEPVRFEVRVAFAGCEIGASRRALRVVETSLPPGYYLPPEDVDFSRLALTDQTTFCEWKGDAIYYDVLVSDEPVSDEPVSDELVSHAAWAYPDPVESFRELKDFVSFYPSLVDCFVDGEKAVAQAGGFYGGWITSHIAGPFKGTPGSERW